MVRVLRRKRTRSPSSMAELDPHLRMMCVRMPRSHPCFSPFPLPDEPAELRAFAALTDVSVWFPSRPRFRRSHRGLRAWQSTAYAGLGLYLSPSGTTNRAWAGRRSAEPR
jgi:hypothetical protein